jgi:HlyD family secretion protein
MDTILEQKKWSVKKIAVMSAGIVIGLFVLVALVRSGKKSTLNVDHDKITLTEVIRAPFQEYISVTGTVEPIQTFYLDLADGGKVMQKFVQEGAFVNAGDPIIKLDNPNLSLQVMSTQSSFLQAESMSRQTRLTFEQNLLTKQDQLLNLELSLLTQERMYENNAAFYAKGMISKNEYDLTREKFETLMKSKALLMEVLKRDSLTLKQLAQQGESNVEMSKNYLALVQNQLANLTVKAPIKGQITSLNAEIGQSINAGYRLGQIDNIDSFKVRTEIDEHYIARVNVGQTGEYELDGGKFVLTIKTVYPQVQNGRFYVDMVFTSGKPHGIRRGQTVHIKLQLGGVTNAVLVENGGFYSSTGGQWIFVVDNSGGFAERRPIKIGRQNPLCLELLEGLKPGERVITSSYENYLDYEKLVIQ